MAPIERVPTDERGAGLEIGYYSVSGELFDRGEPTPPELLYMMETDSQVQSMERAIRLPLQRAELTIEKAEGDKGEAEFVRHILFDPPNAGGMQTPMGQVVQQMISAIFVKRAYFEKVWAINDKNQAVYEKIAFRPVSNCITLMEKQGLKGFKQRGNYSDGDFFDEDFLEKDRKSFIFFHAAAMKPYIGTSILQTAFGDFVDKVRVNRLWNIHLQNYALGTWIGKFVGGVQGGAKRLFRKLRGYMGGGGVMVLEQNEEVDLQNRTGAGSEFEAKAKYMDEQMAGSTHLRWQLLGTASKSGSWALSRDHSDFFLMLEEAELDDIAESINYGVIADLVEVNFGKDAAFPVAKFDPLAEEELDAARDSYMTLSTSAYRPTGPLWEALEERFARSVGIPLEVVQKQHEQDQQTSGLPPSLDPRQTPHGLIQHVQKQLNQQNKNGGAPAAPGGDAGGAQGDGSSPLPGGAGGAGGGGNGTLPSAGSNASSNGKANRLPR